MACIHLATQTNYPSRLYVLITGHRILFRLYHMITCYVLHTTENYFLLLLYSNSTLRSPTNPTVQYTDDDNGDASFIHFIQHFQLLLPHFDFGRLVGRLIARNVWRIEFHFFPYSVFYYFCKRSSLLSS